MLLVIMYRSFNFSEFSVILIISFNIIKPCYDTSYGCNSASVIFQKDPLEAELWSILLAYLLFKLKCHLMTFSHIL